MKVTRRSVGSMLFKGMMAAGVMYDLSKAANAIDNVLTNNQSVSSPELLPSGQSGSTEPSFTGCAGASNIMHNRGHWIISDGRRMIDEGRKLKRKGQGDPYNPLLISRGETMINEGNRMIRKGEAIIKEAASMRKSSK